MTLQAASPAAYVDSALLDYFRCPADVADVATYEHLSVHEGYFTFGGAICYGRCVGASPSSQITGALPDVSEGAAWDGKRLRLPFDLDEVVSNLRQERYRQDPHHVEKITATGTAQSVYYFFRPVLSVAVRKHLQRVRLSGWEQIAFPHWPVDSTVETLMRQAMALILRSGRIDAIPFIWFWPDGASCSATMTHDVETRAGRDFCSELMDLDDSIGLKSSFQLVPEVTYDTSKSLCEFRDRGFEANVHDLNHDGRLFSSRQEFLKRAGRINEYGRTFKSRGFRSGAMYRNQDWYDVLEFSFDMSVPNVAHLEPQRGGCCTVFPYFIGHIVELPLTTIQDYSLFHILGDYSISLWKQQMELILKQNGLITILTHPDYLIEPRARAVYMELLAHLHQIRDERNLWVALPSDVDRWWRSRREMTLVPAGDSWRVEGKDSHRARVAYARLQDDRLVYQIGR
jgi:hypothetical protein